MPLLFFFISVFFFSFLTDLSYASYPVFVCVKKKKKEEAILLVARVGELLNLPAAPLGKKRNMLRNERVVPFCFSILFFFFLGFIA